MTLRRRVGARIRQRRIARGLSISELARRAKLGRITLHRLEAGTQDPTLETLAQVAQALRVRVRDLLPSK